MLALAYTIAMLVTGLCVLRAGALDDRLAFAIMLIASIVSIPITRSGWDGVPIALIAVDSAAMIGFLGIAVISESFWPLWATAFQAATVIMSVVRMIEHRISPYVYASAEFLWSFPVLFAISAGSVARMWKKPSLWRARR